MRFRHPRLFILVSISLLPAATAVATSPGSLCASTAADELRICFGKLARLEQKCYRAGGGPCADTDPKRSALFERVDDRILDRCPDQSAVQAAGFGPALSPAGLAARIRVACASGVNSLAARSYGGPHAAVRNVVSASSQKCLDGAWRNGASLIGDHLRRRSRCIRDAGRGKGCDTAALAERLAARESRTATRIAARCATPLSALVAVGAPAFAARAAEQARCLVASAHGDTAPLALDCGPRSEVPVPARGVTTKVILPHAEWGTRCGNGSDYAFNLRLAPEGSPVERIVVHMEGGGLCLTGADCAGVSAGLFEAISNTLPSGGMLSSSAATNPFRDWTKVSLPYCTQDLHIGGGVTTVFPEITVHRYGAINVRAAMRYVRDLIWAEMQANDPEGYRSDRPVVVFSGGSAGGYGAAYNYHWVLDDLGWVNTTAVPDAALGMDNGNVGVTALGTAVIPATFPGWNALPYLPPYCMSATCAPIFRNLGLATAPRLLATPYQRILHISNQVDTVQVNTTLFPSTASFVNAARDTWCDIQGTSGLYSFLRGQTTSIHGQLLSSNWDSGSIDGVLMRDWLGAAMNDPGSVTDLAEEGTLVDDFPGVEPFPCDTGAQGS